MSPKKKPKLLKSEKKRLSQEKSRLAHDKRGVGVGSRRDFELPARWETQEVERSGVTREQFVSPGKTVYKTQKSVKDTFKTRDRKKCLLSDESSTESDDDAEKDPDFTLETDSEAEKCAKNVESDTDNRFIGPLAPVDVERRMFICETPQLMDFVEQINDTSKCNTPGCEGALVMVDVQPTGLGGSLSASFLCDGCRQRRLTFKGSALVEGSRRTVVGLALSVAFLITGHGFAKFDLTLRQCLGISCISKAAYYDVIKRVYPHIRDILDEMCEEEKEKMKELEEDVLGSWKRAVVTADGVWHTRGHFSKNGSFIVKNYLTGGILWYGHKCMRGKDDVADEELYEGTSKSMEGVLAGECYKQAKDEGFKVESVWQDGDSSSPKSFEEHHPEGKVFKCGGHVGRAHGNQLADAAKRKRFSSDMKTKWKDKFPEIENVECACKRHSKKCGCLSASFIKSAKINHFCCLQQCTAPEEYARRLRALGKYHCMDVHEWGEGIKCGFHPEKVCSCKECEDENNPECEGKEYHTKNKLTCPYHKLEYQIECERRAMDADKVIHPVMGRGHSNLCEAHFNVLPKFRSKDQSLCRLHYVTSTNCGLCQGNMTWCYDVRGPSYHWITELYERLGLPVIPPVVSALEKAVVERKKVLEKQKLERVKQNRISMKVARAEDQEARKKWVKQQRVQHSYGQEDDGSGNEEGSDNEDAEAQALMEKDTVNGQMTIVSGKACRCGSTTHKRTSHRDCPENKRNKSS